ncbi:MAG: DUF4145 domain-containing protein [Pseudomonadota bacterium]
MMSDLRSYCRVCGGVRNHTIYSEKEKQWEDDISIDGGETWSILECRGCDTITFRHRSWFSEDYEITDAQGRPIPNVKVELYPPAPKRKKPEWRLPVLLEATLDDHWIFALHDDIYRALGLGAYSLAAMGIRAIADYIVTSQTGDYGSFRAKLERMRDGGLITAQQVEIVFAAFDAGSASAHRGYKPSEEDAFTLLDIAESLLDQFYITPMRQSSQEKAAAALRKKTPARQRSEAASKE